MMSSHTSVFAVGLPKYMIPFIFFGSGLIPSRVIIQHRQGISFNLKLHLIALNVSPVESRLAKITLSCSICCYKLTLPSTSISPIQGFNPSISSRRSSILALNVSLEAHSPMGTLLHLYLPNSVTIVTRSRL